MRRSRVILLLLAAAAGALLAFPFLFRGAESGGGEPSPEVATRTRAEAPPLPSRPSAPAERRSEDVRGSADPASSARLRVTVLDPWNRPVSTARVRAVSLDRPGQDRWRTSGRGDRISLLLPRGVPLRI